MTITQKTILQNILRGMDTLIPKAETIERLTEKRLKIKWGADPSAPDLHIGHMVVLKKLSQLQKLGHEIIFLIGDFTAQIGDPTGKSETRKALSPEDVQKNAATYQSQVFKLLDPQKTRVVYNSEWLKKLTAQDMIRLTGQYTVARMLEREDFKNRFASETPIGIHEFLYPLLQGYDSVELRADVEIGGTDQTFNMLMGRHLQKEAGMPPQSVIAMPILEGLDGVQKMSKSLQNYIGILDAPKDMFGKIMSIPDPLITRYFTLLTDVPIEAIAEWDSKMKSGTLNPKIVKEKLGVTLVSELHTPESAEAARAYFQTVFSNKQIPDEMPMLPMQSGDRLIEVLVREGIVSSKKEAQRLMDQGAVRLNDEPVRDIFYEIIPDNQVLKVGKRQFFKCIPKA